MKGRAILISISLCLTIMTPLLSIGRGANVSMAAKEPQDLPPVGKDDSQSVSAYDDWHVPTNHGSFASPTALTTTDQYGYTMDDTVSYLWVDARASGVVADFIVGDRDDGHTDAIPIGFDFKYYENIYNQLYISTNGFVSFESGSTTLTNQFLPQDPSPNNIIAPFWDDINLAEIGDVYYWLDDLSSPKKFAIEWNQVVKFGSTDLLTFEIVLYENGDILFQYQDLNGDLVNSTVGVENKEGSDGLLYLYNAPGLASGDAIMFNRPSPSYRVKILPLYQSALSLNRFNRFFASIINTGELGTDTFNLSAHSSSPDWQVMLFQQDGSSPLVDTDFEGLGQVDTGPLAQSAMMEVAVQILPTSSAQVTDYTEVTLTATSSLDASKAVSANFQVAIPASFAQAYADSQNGMQIAQVWEKNARSKPVATYYTGNTLSFDGLYGGKYIYAWEKNGFNQGVNYSNIEYVILNRFGTIAKTTSALTQNENEATQTLFVYGRYPAVAVAPNGYFAVLWVQYKLQLGDPILRNTNIHFAILNPQGIPSFGPVQLTANPQWRGQGDYNIPLHSSPRLVATDDNRFILAWIDNRLQVDDHEVNRIYYAVYTTGGTSIGGGAQLFAQSTPGSTLYIDPALVASDGGILFAYSIYNQVSESYSLAYAMMDSSGVVTQSIAGIPGSSGWRSDGVRVSTGELLLAWTNQATNKIAYVTLNSDGSALLSGPVDLPSVDMRKPDYVSVTQDKDGHAILTWLDVEWNDYLYYAAIDGNGTVLSPPMIFFTGATENPLLQTSFSGQGIAPYEGVWEAYLPNLHR